MIIGIGVDIVKVSRIEKNLDNIKFMKKIYTEKEIEYIQKRNNSPQTASGLFASKEAVSKSLGTGFDGFNITDIEVSRDKKNKPFVILHNKALEISKNLGINSIELSISHEKEYAIAYSIAHKI